MMLREAKNILLTGPPRCGNTTVIERFLLAIPDHVAAGFVTHEVREGGNRVGFTCVGLSSGLSCELAHVDSPSPMRVGRYGVRPEGLDALLERELERIPPATDIVVIDEIGPMELLNSRFEVVVRAILLGPWLVLGTVAQVGDGLIAEGPTLPGTVVIPLTEENRDLLHTDLTAWLKGKLGAKKG